jgi:hypothetical protein
MKRTATFIFFLIFILTSDLFSQSKKLGNWGIITVVLPSNMKHRWGGYIEGQVRTDESLFNHLYYHEYKTGVSYALAKQAVALLGTGRYTTYNYKDLNDGPTIEENRIWEQLTYTQYFNRLKFEHRGRVEQRWLNNIYRNRYRYRLNVIVPVNHPKLEPGTYFITAFNELFFNNRSPSFERNRVASTLGYMLNKSLTIQTGWLYQYNHASGGNSAKHNLTLNLTYQITRK